MSPDPPPSSSQHLARGAVGFPTALATAVGLVMASPVLTASSGVSLGGKLWGVAMARQLPDALVGRLESDQLPR